MNCTTPHFEPNSIYCIQTKNNRMYFVRRGSGTTCELGRTSCRRRNYSLPYFYKRNQSWKSSQQISYENFYCKKCLRVFTAMRGRPALRRRPIESATKHPNIQLQKSFKPRPNVQALLDKYFDFDLL